MRAELERCGSLLTAGREPDHGGGGDMSACERPKSGRVVRAGDAYTGKQGLDYTPGVSAQTVGSTGLWVGTVVIPPGVRTRAYLQYHLESAFFIKYGEEVVLCTGHSL